MGCYELQGVRRQHTCVCCSSRVPHVPIFVEVKEEPHVRTFLVIKAEPHVPTLVEVAVKEELHIDDEDEAATRLLPSKTVHKIYLGMIPVPIRYGALEQRAMYSKRV